MRTNKQTTNKNKKKTKKEVSKQNSPPPKWNVSLTLKIAELEDKSRFTVEASSSFFVSFLGVSFERMKPPNCLFFFFFSSKRFCLRTTCVQSTLVRFKTDSFQPYSFCPEPVLYTEIASVLFDLLQNPAPDFSSCTMHGECWPGEQTTIPIPRFERPHVFSYKRERLPPPVLRVRVGSKM